MSQGADKYKSGGKEFRRRNRSQGKTILKNTQAYLVGGTKKTSMAKEQDKKSSDFYYIRNAVDQIEVIRRIDIVRSELLRRVLLASSGGVYGGEIITQINLLIQLPIILFLYRKEGDVYRYQKSFDVEKFKISRQSLKLVAYKFDVPDGSGGGEVEIEDLTREEISSNRLFRVFDTNYFLRCFLLDVDGDNQPFYEVTKFHNSSLGISYEYVRVCLNGVLSHAAKELSHFSSSFRGSIFGEISKILQQYSYVPPHPGRSAITKMPGDEQGSEAYRKGRVLFSSSGNFDSKLRKNKNREIGGLDFSLEGTVFDKINKSLEISVRSSAILRKNERSPDGVEFDDGASNLFLMLRSSSRYKKRAAGDEWSKGYSFNVEFNISKSQRYQILNYLRKLSILGRDGYRKYGNKIVRNELYGGYDNPKGLKWDFGSKLDSVRHSAYQNFAKSLDEWFWSYLDWAGKDFNDRSAGLLSVFVSPVGGSSVSMVDPIFYYGASIYRMPFRRQGGLGRLMGLAKLYDELSADERPRFSFDMLVRLRRKSKIEYIETRRDCIRVVLFFYLTRLLSIPEGAQSELDTKIHFYPITVSGVVIGAVGKVSYDFKEIKKKREQSRLPTTRSNWDEEMMFYSAVVVPLESSLCTQYFDLQIDFLVKSFASGVISLVAALENNQGNDFTRCIKELEQHMNATSGYLARVCPYPAIKFTLIKNTQGLPNDLRQRKHYVDLGDATMFIELDSSPSIFRALTRVSELAQHNGVKVLLHRILETALLLLPSEDHPEVRRHD